MPNAPSFISTPACSIDTAVGAAAWPSGDHGWEREDAAQRAAAEHDQREHDLLERRVVGRVEQGRQVERAETGLGEDAEDRGKIRIDAATSIIISFIAPYSRRPDPHTAMSRYIGSTAVS